MSPKEILFVLIFWAVVTLTSAKPISEEIFEFLPSFQGKSYEKYKLEFVGKCYGLVVVSSSLKNNNLEITIELHNRKNSICEENILFVSLKQFHPGLFRREGIHYSKMRLDKNEIELYQLDGLRIYLFEDNIFEALASLWKTLELFIGFFISGRNWIPGAAAENVQYLREMLHMELKERKHERPLLSVNNVLEGDCFFCARMDGLDPFVMVHLGCTYSHVGIFIKDPVTKKMQGCQSMDGNYWPDHGIACMEYNKFMETLVKNGMHCYLQPLTAEARKKFNSTAAWNRAKEFFGLPFGYETIIYSLLDTLEDNYIPPLNSDILFLVALIFNSISPPFTEQVIAEPISQRLNIPKTDLYSAFLEIYRRKKTLADIIMIPERDEWNYTTGKSRFCSAYAFEVLRASGVFDKKIASLVQSVEVTPRDLGALNIFDKNPKLPLECRTYDPGYERCALSGRHYLDVFWETGTIELYPGYAERCPTIPPDYKRLEGC